MLRSLFSSSKKSQGSRMTAVKQINAAELHQWLDEADKPLLLVDVRTPGEFEYDGHIGGSQLFPLSSLMARMDELPKDQTIVCVCRSGARSYTACEMLASNGFDVVNLSGGMIGWKRANFLYK